MLRCVTVHELSLVTSFCRFFHFSIYISVRFVYISVTFFSTLLFHPAFPPCLLKSTPCHFYLVMRAICGIFLILLAFFLPKRLPKLAKTLVKMASN